MLLIEGDLRKPVISRRLNLRERSGLSDMLLESGKDAIQSSGYGENFKVICAGSSTGNPSELLGSHSMDILIDKERNDFDYIIVDLPPVNEVSDAITVSRLLDGIIFVIKQGVTNKMTLDAAMYSLNYSKSELLGFVLSNASVGGKYGKYGKYGRYGRYGKYGKYYYSGYGEQEKKE